MLKISDFSKLAQVPTATLRYYDQLGLLKPAAVDKFTEYRFYAVDQLPRLNRILALRDLGFSLDQIAGQLNGNPSARELRDMLVERRSGAEREIAEAQDRLARVEQRLRFIEAEGAPPQFDLVVKAVAPQWVVSVRKVVPQMDQMGDFCAEMHATLLSWIGTSGLVRLGLPAPQMLNLYHNAEYTETDLDVEAAVMVARPVSAGRVESGVATGVGVKQISGYDMVASGIHRGPMEDAPMLAQALFAWVGQNDYTIVGPLRELHLAGQGESDVEPVEHIVELQLPIEKS
ncbi:MAG: MerR family transcriptional regulator [Thermoflexales bacterium]